MNHLIEYKLNTLKKNLSIKSFQDSWRIWGPEVSTHLVRNVSGKKIFKLAEELRAIFQTNKGVGRGQSGVVKSGNAWECLNVWYLNLLFWGTSVVVTRTNNSLVPECIRNAITVTHSSTPTNKESDISIFNIPDANLLASNTLKDIDGHLEKRMRNINYVNLQCKTNWNENAQIPMLWDLIYQVDKFKISSVNVGINGVSPSSFSSFRYAFSTVPTNNLTAYKATTLNVLRLKNLSGGNYWGHSTSAGIAKCINELPGNQFGQEFSGGLINHLDDQINKDPNFIKMFLKLKFSS